MPRLVALDSNVLLLLIVGLTNKSYVSRHRKLEAFTLGDFETLQLLMQDYQGVLITPNVLTETSNLAFQKHDNWRPEIAATFASVVKSIAEQYVPSSAAVVGAPFFRLGLTDATLAEAGVAIISTDGPLCRALEKQGYDVVNFNHWTEAAGV